MKDEREKKFTCPHGELICLPVDMKQIRAEVAEWEDKNHAPAVPLIAQETFEARVSGRGVDMMPNPHDPAYKRALEFWDWRRYQFMEAKVISRSVRFDEPTAYTTIALILVSQERLSLFRFIVNISEVTQEAVDKAARRFRLHLARQAYSRLACKNGKGRYSYSGNGVQGSGRVVQFTRLEGRQAAH